MDDPLLMCVLDGPANQREQLEPFADGKMMLIAEVSHLHAADQLHDEIRPSRGGGAGVEDPGNIRVVHQSQRLSFRFEPSDDRLGIHSQLNDLQRYMATNRLKLLRHVNHPAPAFADLLEQLTAADSLARLLAHWPRGLSLWINGCRRLF